MSRNYPYHPNRFFGLVFLVTFVFWLSGGYVSHDQGRGGLYTFLMFLGLITPFAISLVMIVASKNPVLKNDFVNRLINIRLFELTNLPLLILMMPIVVLASILISLPFGGSLQQLQFAEGFSFSMGAAPVLLVLILAAAFEELGWRGYAFDALQSRYSFFAASLIFSLLWSLWHLPLLWVNGSYQQQVLEQNVWFAVNFFVSIIPMGMIISWVCIRNNKSVLAAILFHFIINISQEVLGMTQITKSIETGVLLIVVIIIIYFDRELYFASAQNSKTRSIIPKVTSFGISQ